MTQEKTSQLPSALFNDSQNVPQPQGQAFRQTEACLAFSTPVKLPPQPTKFDEHYFLFLFAGSLSLGLSEKKKILAQIATLSPFQIQGLIQIMESEIQTFSDLAKKHPEQVARLHSHTADEWAQIELEYEYQQRQPQEALLRQELLAEFDLKPEA